MKRYFSAILALFLVAVLITGCFQLPKAPDSIKTRVNNVIEKWNNLYANELEIISWNYEGILDDPVKYQEVLALLTDPDSVRIVHTDITDPGLLSLLLLSAVPADSQKEFKESVEGLVEIGQHLVKLKWKAPASGEEFVTTALVEEDNIVWDSILGSVVEEEFEITPAGGKSGEVTIKWFWGAERGSISWSLECSGPPLQCSYDSKAKMTSGEARIETRLVKTEECCTLYYGWAYRTPTGSISIDWNPETNQYDIEVSSWGSTGSGQGILECCM